MKKAFPRHAFTLIELLVVIAVIAVLASILMVALSGVSKKGNQTKAMNNLRQVGSAFLLYAGEHNYTLPGRLADAPNQATPKWPALLAGTDGSGARDVSTNYVGDVKVYIAPGDQSVNPERPDLFEYLTSNSENRTAWIMNGYNDVGTKNDPSLQIRTTAFSSAADTIILGMLKPGSGNFYMDFTDGDNNSVLNLTAYTNGSPYLFGDGSVKFITQDDYKKPSPQGSGYYGDYLWLTNKSNSIPAAAP